MLKHVSIRLAVPGERAELEALQFRSSMENSGDRDALLANPDAIVLPVEQITAGQVFVAETVDGIVGFAAVLPRADGETVLDGLFTAPGFWGHGVGRSLVDRCSAYAIANGSQALHVVGNPHATGIYVACGFTTLRECTTRFGMALLMRKMLLAVPA